ncbi:MAG: hypothetical protein ACKVWV_11525 [Planctomycetota bacterium]
MVWVQPVVALRFRTIALDGTPIGGVTCHWAQQLAPVYPEPKSPLLTAISEVSGLVTVRGPCIAGRAIFTKDGYTRQELLLNGPSSNTIDVVLEPDAHDGRPLRFRYLATGLPVHAVQLRAALGYSIAHASVESDTVVVPSWVSPDEVIHVESATTHPSRLRLRDVATNDVELPESRALDVLIHAGSGCDPGRTLRARLVNGTSTTSVRPDLPSPITTSSAHPVRVTLPAGVGVELEAFDTCGSREIETIGPSDSRSVVELYLEALPRLDVSVRDPSGRAVASAVVHAVRNGGTTDGVPCDASGRASIPLAPDVDSIRVDARSHASSIAVRVGAAAPLDRSTDEELLVTLQPSVDVPLRVRSTSGDPVSGLLVRVWPQPAATANARSGSWRFGTAARAIVGNSDDRGEFVARDVPLGLVDIEVDLDHVFGSGDAYETLYDVPRVSMHIASGDAHTIVVPTPRVVSLSVFDGTCDEPVPSFELAVEDSSGRTALDVPGNHWRGWIASDLDALIISVNGLGSTTLDPRQVAPGDAARVVLQPTVQVLFRVENLPELRPIQHVRLRVMRKTSNGHQGVQDALVTLDGDRGAVSLATTDDLVVGIDPIEHAGKTLRFEPPFQPASTDVELVFYCRY